MRTRFHPRVIQAGWLAALVFLGLAPLCPAEDGSTPAFYRKQATWQATLWASVEAARPPEPVAVPAAPGSLDLARDPFTFSAWIRTRADGTVFAKAPAGGVWQPDGKALFLRRGHLCYDIGWVGCITGKATLSDGDYAADVQPVWDRHCLHCHGANRQEAKLDLRGTLTERFSVSYEALVPERRAAPFDRGLLGPVTGENHPKTGNVDYLPALSLGSHASVLMALLSQGGVTLADPAQAARAAKLIAVHEKIRLVPEELVRVATWVDTNAQYYGMYWGRRNVRYKDLPGFRPVPSFDMARSLTLPAGLAAK